MHIIALIAFFGMLGWAFSSFLHDLDHRFPHRHPAYRPPLHAPSTKHPDEYGPRRYGIWGDAPKPVAPASLDDRNGFAYRLGRALRGIWG